MKRTWSTESDLLKRIARRAQISRSSRLVCGIGDDCAVYRTPGSSEDLLITTDMLLEDVHFRRETHPARTAGHKALARGLSDIAAMGGDPRFCLLSLAVPQWATPAWVDGFYDGFLRLAARYGIVLAGGDLARSERMACDVVVCGTAPRNRWLRRDQTKAGDHIYVSGRLGGSALGLATQAGAAWRRHLRPEPRIELGRFLRDHLAATAAMDLSDGLSLDLRRLCDASGAAAEIVPPPRFPGASIDQALHGGEDYELLFTLPPGAKPPASFRGIRLTRIGSIVKGKRGTVRLDGKPLPARGWDHLARLR
ncbi:MAG: thiamine-phosphate kinase [Bryobacteraceae bacterium]